MKTSRHLNPLAFFPTCKARVPVFLKNLVTLFLFSFLLFSSKTFGQIGSGVAPVNTPSGKFSIEGDLQANFPVVDSGDWIPGPAGTGGYVLDAAGVPLDPSKTFHLIDLYNSGSDNNFAGGDKFNDNPSTWNWTLNPVGAKVDINNALMHFTTDANGHTWVIVAADRRSDNGDAYIDFEFLQNKLSANNDGSFSTEGPDGGRTVNDFVLTLKLTGGGNTASFLVERWEETSPGVFDYIDRTSDLPLGATFAAVNTADGTPVSFDAFGGNTYDKNTFVEGAVDLTALVGNFNPCLELGINTIFIKTKESQADNANIVDFISPLNDVDLTLGIADAGKDQTKCSEGASTSFTLDGKALPDQTVSFHWEVFDGTAIIDNPNSLTTTVQVSSPTTTIRLIVETISGCSPAVHDDVVLTVTSAPDNTFELTATNYCSGDPAKGSVTLSGSETGVSCQLVDLDGQPVDDPKIGDGNALTWTGLGANTYHVVFTSPGKCTSESLNPAEVEENPTPDVAPNAFGDGKCGGGNITLEANCSDGNNTAVWYDAETGGTQLATGSSYIVSVTETTSFWVSCVTPEGCASPRAEAVATFNTIPVKPIVDGSGATKCYYDGIKITASASTSDGSSVVWYDAPAGGNTVSDPSLDHVGSVTYYAQGVSGAGADACASTERSPATLTIDETPGTPSVGVVNNCNGTSTLTVTGLADGAAITWSDDASNHDNPRIVNAAGTYKVTQTLGECTSGEGSGDAAPKTAPSAPSVGVVNNCNGTSTLTVTGLADGATITWSDDATNHSNPRIVNAAGTYKVTQTVNGCTSNEGSGTAAPKTPPAAPSASGTTVCAPNSATASASGCSGTLTWYDAATGGNVVATGVSSVTTSTTKTYYVSCTVNGCESARKAVTAIVNICTGIYPTATSCAGFNSGTIQFLPRVCIATKKSKTGTTVSGATPGVFFYYTKITAPSATFDVYIDQTQCSSLNKNFAVQQTNQVFAYTNGCGKIATGAQASTIGDAVIHITKATAGQPVIIGIKYDVKSIVGATITGSLPLSCTTNFVTRLGTTNAGSIIANTSTSILVTSNCSASALIASSSIGKPTLNESSAIRVKAYPNPYTNVVNFSIVSPVSGKAVLEAYNMLGQRVAIIFEGNVDAGVQHNFKYIVPAGNRVPLMYKLTVGGQTFHGTLIPAR